MMLQEVVSLHVQEEVYDDVQIVGIEQRVSLIIKDGFWWRGAENIGCCDFLLLHSPVDGFGGILFSFGKE